MTTSHAVMVRLLMKLGEGHNEQVKMWQESLTTALSLEQVYKYCEQDMATFGK